jgi:hypothetical protein
VRRGAHTESVADQHRAGACGIAEGRVVAQQPTAHVPPARIRSTTYSPLLRSTI